MVDLNYYSDESLFIEGARKFLDVAVKPHVDQWEKADGFPNEIFQSLGSSGFLGILLPEQFGGIDGSYKLAAAWCEIFGEIPATGFVTGVNMHSLVISAAIAKYGTDVLKNKWLAAAIRGEKIGAYAFTEPGAGSDLANIRTKAERRNGKWVINGAKTFITNGARAHFILVLTRNDFGAGYKGFTTFVVDTSSPGFKVQKKLDKLGWRSSDTAELLFENVEVDDSAILGQVGDGWIQAAKNLNWERLMLTLTTIGGAKACHRESVKYAKDRTAFGKPIIEIDAVSSTLTEMWSRIVLWEALTHKALDLFCEGKECRAEVSAAKRLVCDEAVLLADRAIQIHGGYGYTKEFHAERWWRDLRLMPIGGGTSEIMGNIAGKQLGLMA